MNEESFRGLIAQGSRAFWRWVAKRVQPHLEPNTSITGCNFYGSGTGTAVRIEDQGIRIDRGTRVTGGG